MQIMKQESEIWCEWGEKFTPWNGPLWEHSFTSNQITMQFVNLSKT